MNTLSSQATPARLPFIASAVAGILLALFTLPLFAYINVIWDPSYYGELGLDVCFNNAGNVVSEVVPGSPADKAGIMPGDIVERPQTLRDRLLTCTWNVKPRPGERLTLSIHRGEQRRTLTLRAVPVAPLSTTAAFLLVLKAAWLFIGIAVALVLVLLRPSKMTWAFYLFALNLVLVVGPPTFFLSYIPAAWNVAYETAIWIIAPAGVAGFLIFCVRFPANEVSGWRKPIENLALYLFVPLAGFLVYINIILSDFQYKPMAPILYYAAVLALTTGFVVGTVVLLVRYFRARPLEQRQLQWIVLALVGAIILCVRDLLVGPDMNSQWAIFAAFVVGTVVVLVTYFGARGLERHRINWVVLGFVSAFAATAVDFLWDQFSPHPAWYIGVLEALYVVLPITVAYAVIRHRVIDVRFVASRSLAVGVIVSMVILVVIGVDWLFSTRLPNSRFETAAYAAVALVVGFSLNAARQKVGKTIDFVFFRPWYRTHERALVLVDAMRHATSKTDLYQPLTSDIANVFSLASVALFERVEDAGFVRVAAHGWPPGTIWHILSDDPFVERTAKNSRVANIEALEWREHDLPAGVARPVVMLPIVAGRRVPAVLLCGSHENGTALDPDEIRTIRRICADASLIYGRLPTSESGRIPYLDQQIEPLGA